MKYARRYVDDVEFYAEDAGRTDNEYLAPEICEFVINGHTIKNIRMEQAYKGNFHHAC